MKLKPGRINCCVPFCRRTRTDIGFAEWICQPHWRLVPKQLKRRKRLAERIEQRASAIAADAFSKHGSRGSRRLIARANATKRLKLAAWVRCKRTAIERALGI